MRARINLLMILGTIYCRLRAQKKSISSAAIIAKWRSRQSHKGRKEELMEVFVFNDIQGVVEETLQTCALN